MVNEIILFEAHDKSITLPVHLEQETVWLNRNQMAELYGRDVKTIGKHISNALKEELDPSTVAKFATVQMEGDRTVKHKTVNNLTHAGTGKTLMTTFDNRQLLESTYEG
jgi:hypothetical protein